jgi:probable phosphoglycerate mutase
MTELLLLRHALPVSGDADPGLSEVGQAQAERVAQWLTGRHVDAVVTSPLRRARETAAPIEAALGLTADVVDDLREWELDDPDYVYDALEDMAPDDPRLLAVAEGRYDGKSVV